MSPLPSFETIQTDVIGIVAQALMIKPDRVGPGTRLFSDLGAESIDVLDIRFRLERHFKLTIPDGAIVKSLGTDLSADEIDAAFTPMNIARFIASMLGGQPA